MAASRGSGGAVHRRERFLRGACVHTLKSVLFSSRPLYLRSCHRRQHGALGDMGCGLPSGQVSLWQVIWLWPVFCDNNHRIRPNLGKVWAKIETAMMARNPSVRWTCVRCHLSAVIVTLLQHNWIPSRHTSWKEPEGNRWILKTGRVGIDDWGFWQAFGASTGSSARKKLTHANLF